MIPGLNFATGGGGLDFGANTGGDARGGPISIDARTTTGGGDPELIGQLFPVAALVVAGFVAYLFLKRR